MTDNAVSRVKHCVYCCRPEDEVGTLSGRGNCVECGNRALVENVMQLKSRQGPHYEHFVKRRAALAVRRLRQLGDSVTT